MRTLEIRFKQDEGTDVLRFCALGDGVVKVNTFARVSGVDIEDEHGRSQPFGRSLEMARVLGEMALSHAEDDEVHLACGQHGDMLNVFDVVRVVSFSFGLGAPDSHAL